MDTITLLQHYWWLIISLLGALLVFLMFVQGGQALLYTIGRTEEERNMLVNSLGRKWEFTFTTLVTFGGAFFASFPLFYSTSFGGAFYVWMAILLCFVIQAVAYEYRRKPGNVFGERTFNAFLLVNGVLGPLLIGTAVGTFFTGAEFTVDRLNLANQGGAAVISQWATPWHGLEAVAEWRNVLLGLSVTLLAMTLACQYFMNNIDDEAIFRRAARRMRTFAVLFVACFVAWLLALVLADGWAVDAAGTVSVEPYKYLHNLVEMPYVAAALLIGVVSVLWSVWLGLGDLMGFAENMSPLGNASAEDCADYVLTLFSDLTRKVTMQNLYHDGGFSSMGMSRRAMKTYEKGMRFEDVHENQYPFGK